MSDCVPYYIETLVIENRSSEKNQTHKIFRFKPKIKLNNTKLSSIYSISNSYKYFNNKFKQIKKETKMHKVYTRNTDLNIDLK